MTQVSISFKMRDSEAAKAWANAIVEGVVERTEFNFDPKLIGNRVILGTVQGCRESFDRAVKGIVSGDLPSNLALTPERPQSLRIEPSLRG